MVRAMCTMVRSPRCTAAWAVEHEQEPPAVSRPLQTAYFAAVQPTTGHTERGSLRGVCCFQLLPRGDHRLDQVGRSQSDVDAETLQPQLLVQAPKLQLRDLHAQAGGRGYAGVSHVVDFRVSVPLSTSSVSRTARTTSPLDAETASGEAATAKGTTESDDSLFKIRTDSDEPTDA